ncbi:MAG: D-glycero-beta-D-manno-heptose-1,7-bisphosphate 7-phosphatase, partial [Inhella sp.]
LRDLQTALAAGCQPHLVRGDRLAAAPADRLEEMLAEAPGARVHEDLAAFADWLLDEERRQRAQRGEPVDPDSRPAPL